MLNSEEDQYPRTVKLESETTPGSSVHAIVTESLDYMTQAMPRFLADLRMLCLTESPSDDPSGLNKMAEHLSALLQQVGMQTTLVEHPRGNAVVGTIMGQDAAGPTCLLLGHHDTVHPLGVAASRTRLTAERFYAPGTVDMKAGLLQGIYALENTA